MRRVVKVLSAAAWCVLLGTAGGSEERPEQVAAKAAESWLSLVDQGKYVESWDSAAKLFQGAVTREKWKDALSGTRAPLGKLISRSMKSAQYTTSLPGAPDGKYVVIQFTASFQNKKEALETVTPMQDSAGAWKVSGYFIR